MPGSQGSCPGAAPGLCNAQQRCQTDTGHIAHWPHGWLQLEVCSWVPRCALLLWGLITLIQRDCDTLQSSHARMLNFSLSFHAANRWALLAAQEQECKSIKHLYSSFSSSSSHMLFTRIAERLLWGAAPCKARFLICWEEQWSCTGCSGLAEDSFQ